ncbi:MAG: DUF4215 domain-containing protein [Deltaproteobacteria bacterium]|nr:DUF4215 domain-containing protein [Deltaproteobacteria bacterium]
MRFISAVTISMLAAACGGGKDPVDIIDSAPKAVCGNGQLESPEQCDDGNTADGDGCSSTCTTETALCAVKDDLTSLSIGSQQQRATGDWFDTPAQGPNAGRKEFVIGARLPADLDNSNNTNDGMIVELFATAGVFVANQAKNFDTSPGAASNMVAYDAAAFVLGDFDQAGTVLNLYWARNGSITLSAVGEANGAAITGTVTATDFADVDETGNVIPGGCTTKMGGLQLFLTQMAGAKPGAPGILKPGEPGAMSREELQAMLTAVRERRIRAK